MSLRFAGPRGYKYFVVLIIVAAIYHYERNAYGFSGLNIKRCCIMHTFQYLLNSFCYFLIKFDTLFSINF